MKKCCCLLLAFLICISCIVCNAEDLPTRVFDNANCFSVEGPNFPYPHFSDTFFSQQLEELLQQIQSTRNELGWDFAVLTIDDYIGADTHPALAKAFYDQMGLGIGEQRSGILYMLDVNQNLIYLYASGECTVWLTEEIRQAIVDYQFGEINGQMYYSAPYWCLLHLQGAWSAYTYGYDYIPPVKLIPPT